MTTSQEYHLKGRQNHRKRLSGLRYQSGPEPDTAQPQLVLNHFLFNQVQSGQILEMQSLEFLPLLKTENNGLFNTFIP